MVAAAVLARSAREPTDAPGCSTTTRGSLAVASPPQRENTGEFAGYPHPTVLAACALLGVGEVYAMGGAQAVAAFAFEVTFGGFSDAVAKLPGVERPVAAAQ